MKDQLQQVGDLLADAALLDLDDFFAFHVQSMRVMEIQETNGIQRCTIRSLVAGRRFESLTIDIGANHELPDPVQMITTTNLLEFAGFDPVIVPALPLEIHVAEKLHAYTKPYDDGRQNTRVKDLIDLVLIASLSRFELHTLRTAIVRSFAGRRTQLLPVRLSRPGEHWRLPYAQLAREVALPENLDDGFAAAAAFLDPALDAFENQRLRWDPERFGWYLAEPNTTPGAPSDFD